MRNYIASSKCDATPPGFYCIKWALSSPEFHRDLNVRLAAIFVVQVTSEPNGALRRRTQHGHLKTVIEYRQKQRPTSEFAEHCLVDFH